MKHSNRKIIPYNLLYCLAMGWMFFLYSCETFNFTHPQPVDKNDMKQFPATITGRWITDDKDTILIGTSFIGFIKQDDNKIVKGAWPRVSSNREWLMPPVGYDGWSTIHYDSTMNPVDTTEDYIISGSHIYTIESDKSLGPAFHYKQAADTFFASNSDTISVDLGINVLLRNTGEGIYVLNIRNQVMGMENRWWQIILIEIVNNDHIIIWDCTSKMAKEPSMFYRNEDNYYFNSSWTGADIKALKKKGMFDLCYNLRRQKK